MGTTTTLLMGSTGFSREKACGASALSDLYFNFPLRLLAHRSGS
jgi:hypothetical protein